MSDDNGEPYGTEDLYPMHLEHGMVRDHESVQSESKFKAWSVRAGQGKEEGVQPSVITV